MSQPESSSSKRRRSQGIVEAIFPVSRRKPRSNANQRPSVAIGTGPIPVQFNLEEGFSFCGSPKDPAYAYAELTNARVKACIQSAKWHYICQVAQHKNDQQCVLALMERWWDTTHTFHLPLVEVGFTPFDFTCLTGIPVGNSNALPPFDKEKYSKFEEMEAFFPMLRKVDTVATGVKCAFLKRLLDNLRLPQCDDKDAVPTTQEKECETMWLRAFFLLVIGELFFPNSKKYVDRGWFAAVKEVDSIGVFDWGTPILCQIYSGLDETSRERIHQGQFCWTVLQVDLNL